MGLILPQEVEVKVNPKNVNYYKNLGYEIPIREASDVYKQMHKKNWCYDLGSIIKVDIKDLPYYSRSKVKCECDYCHDIFEKGYSHYLDIMNSDNPKVSCRNCNNLKMRETNVLRHGNPNYNNIDKAKETFKIKYGKFNPAQVDSIKEKIRNTNLSKYGYTSPGKNEQVKNKAKETNLKRYNTVSPSLNIEIRKKISNTFYKNSSQKVSSQQLYISNLYHAELNYPISHFNVDMAFINEKLICEYNGGGHWLNIETGRETQEEYNKKEIVRNAIIKKAGWKQIIIISRKDKLPSDEKLLEILEYSRNYFKDNPQRSWIEFDVDNSTMRNALCKDNAQHYDFGELHTLPRKTA